MYHSFSTIIDNFFEFPKDLLFINEEYVISFEKKASKEFWVQTFLVMRSGLDINFQSDLSGRACWCDIPPVLFHDSVVRSKFGYYKSCVNLFVKVLFAIYLCLMIWMRSQDRIFRFVTCLVRHVGWQVYLSYNNFHLSRTVGHALMSSPVLVCCPVGYHCTMEAALYIIEIPLQKVIQKNWS